MIKVTVDKKGYYVPANWNEITYKQYLLLTNNGRGLVGVLSILLNESVSLIENWNIDIDVRNKLAKIVSFLNELPNLTDFAIPKTLTIGISQFDVPKDLDKTPFGCKIYCEDLINSKKYTDSELLPYIVASLFEHKYNKKPFCSENIDVFLPIILECSFYEVWKIGTFFLRSLLGLPKFGVNYLAELERMKTDLRSSRDLAVKN